MRTFELRTRRRGVSPRAVIALVVVLGGTTGGAVPTAAAAEGAPPALVVDTLADLPYRSGDVDCTAGRRCSLRAAVQLAAHLDPSTPVRIELGPGRHELEIPATGADDAAGGDLDVRRDLTIVGAGPQHTTVDGGGIDRILDVHGSPTVRLERLTLSGGSPSGAGGAIRIGPGRADVRLDEVELSGNRSAIGTGGGAIAHAGGTLRIERSTIAGNHAGSDGGGVEASDGQRVEVVSSTIADNVAGLDGGGVFAEVAAVSVHSSTISGNETLRGGGGLRADAGGLEVRWSTIADNVAGVAGGGLAAGGALVLEGTLLAGNRRGTISGDCLVQGGPDGRVTSLGHNLATDATCPLGHPDDLVVADARLGPLTLAGGATPVRPLLEHSPAIDAGGPCPAGADRPGVDQRGVRRPLGAACDIGAVEFVPVAVERCVAGYLDVDLTQTHVRAICELTDRGSVRGFDDGRFRPNRSVTRGQLATIVASAMGLSPPAEPTDRTGPRFTDVPAGSTHAWAVGRLADDGVVGGYPDGTFRPGDPLTRGQAASVLARALGLDLDGDGSGPAGFTDVAPGTTHATAIDALTDRGVVAGFPDGTYRPGAPVTRGQLTTLVVGAFDLAG